MSVFCEACDPHSRIEYVLEKKSAFHFSQWCVKHETPNRIASIPLLYSGYCNSRHTLYLTALVLLSCSV